MYQEGQITIAKCRKCGNEFSVFTFVADTDMVTAGCVALSGPGNNIVLTEQDANESDSDIEARIGNGDGIVQVRYANSNQTPKGLSFQSFQKAHKPPVPIYSCINCGSDADEIKIETKEQFLAHGKIEVRHGS